MDSGGGWGGGGGGRRSKSTPTPAAAVFFNAKLNGIFNYYPNWNLSVST